MNYCLIGARQGLGTSSLALALTKSLEGALYISLDFGAKDLSRSLNLDPGIYDLFDVTNREAKLEDALGSFEGLNFIEAPLTKSLEDLDREGLGALKDQAQKNFDHLVWDLGPGGLDLVDQIKPDQLTCLGPADLPGLYRLEDLVFRLRDYHKILTPIITGVEDLDK